MTPSVVEMSPTAPRRPGPTDGPASGGPASGGHRADHPEPGRPGAPGASGQPPLQVDAAGVAAFGVEVALVVLVAVAGWRLGDSAWLSPVLCVVLVLVVAVLWGVWLAPHAARRLPVRARVVAKAVLFAAVAALALAAGLTWWAVAFVVVAWASLAWTRG